MDWFNSRYSNDDLTEILSDYSKAVYGYRTRMNGSGRCSLVRELEALDAEVAFRKSTPEGRAAMREQGWIVEEEFSPFETVNS